MLAVNVTSQAGLHYHVNETVYQKLAAYCNHQFVQHGANIHLHTSSMCGSQNAFNTKTPLGSSYNNIFELPGWKLYDIRVSWPSSTHVEAVFQFGTSVQ